MSDQNPVVGTIHADWSHGNAYKHRGKLNDLWEELQKQRESKKDAVIDTRDMVVEPNEGDGELRLRFISERAKDMFEQKEPIPIRPHALAQLGARLNPAIPIKYLRKLAAERPHLAAHLLTEKLQKPHDDDGEEGRLMFVRTLYDSARGFLSPKYRVLDHSDMFMTALDVAKTYGARPLEATLTETNMSLKLVLPDLVANIDFHREHTKNWFSGALGNQQYLKQVSARSVGELDPDGFYPVVTARNSETGHGGSSAWGGGLLGCCFNLATVERVLAQVHLGKAMDPGIFSADTRAMDARASVNKVRDLIRSMFTEESFNKIVAKIEGSIDDKVKEPAAAVDNVVKALKISDAHRDDILQHFLQDYDQTRFGLAQAVSRIGQDTADPDVAEVFECAAGQIMSDSDMTKVAALVPA